MSATLTDRWFCLRYGVRVRDWRLFLSAFWPWLEVGVLVVREIDVDRAA